jgi:hypothetical protein
MASPGSRGGWLPHGFPEQSLHLPEPRDDRLREVTETAAECGWSNPRAS